MVRSGMVHGPLVVDVSPWLDHLAVLRQKLGCGGFVLDEQDRLRGLDDREKEVDDASDRGVREDDGDALDQHVQLRAMQRQPSQDRLHLRPGGETHVTQVVQDLRPIKQSNKHTLNQSIKQSHNHTIIQTLTESRNQLSNQSITQSSNQSSNQSGEAHVTHVVQDLPN